MTEMWWRSYLHRWKLLDLDLQRDLGVSRSPRSKESRIHGALGGNQEKVWSLTAWALSWERGVLDSLYIKEALDKNKNKLKHEFQTARTPGLSKCPSLQGNKFLPNCAPTSPMNRIYSFIQHTQLPGEGTFAQLKTLCSEAGNVALNPPSMLRELNQGLMPCSTLPTWPLGREDSNTALSAESAQQDLGLVWHSPGSRLIKGNGYPDAHTRMVCTNYQTTATWEIFMKRRGAYQSGANSGR